MRGGTPAVFDAALGGYLALFHSSVNHDPDGRPNCRGKRRTYYMGGVVYAPRPPFAIQQVT